MPDPHPNSATWWLPRITAAGLPVPKTEVVPVPEGDHASAVGWAEGDDIPEPAFVAEAVDAAARVGYPAFIRGDQVSAKHDGPDSYRATNPSEVRRCVAHAAVDHELKLMFGPAMRGILVREWLDLDAPFRAFGWHSRDGHPVAREWRYFAAPDGILCAHFYWPEGAIKFRPREPEPPAWREQLRSLATTGPSADLPGWAVAAARTCPRPDVPAWSVDFARDRAGKWWLIDMATIGTSWHPTDCPNAPKRPGPPEDDG